MKLPYRVLTSAALALLLSSVPVISAYATTGDFYDTATKTVYTKADLTANATLANTLQGIVDAGKDTIVKESSNGKYIDYEKASADFLTDLTSGETASQALSAALISGTFDATNAGLDAYTSATATATTTVKTELAKVTNASLTTVPYGTANTQIAVEAAITTLANADVDSGYTVAIAPGSTYSTVTKAWTGEFTVTNTATTATATDTTYRAITIATGVSTAGATSELANNVTNASLATVPYGTANNQTAVESAILKLANADVDSGYTVTIAPGSTYSTVTKVWTGELIATNNTTPANTATDAIYRSITVVTSSSTTGAATELAKVTNASVTTVPFGTANNQTAVEAAITTLANADIDSATSGYTVTIAPGSTYSTVSKIWTGKLTVTNSTDATNTVTDATYRNITVATGADTTATSSELGKVTTALGTAATVPYGTANTQTGVESAILVLANADVDSGYTVTIAPGSTYSTASKIWTGEFTVTNNTDATNTVTEAAPVAITIATSPSTAGATSELANNVTNASLTTVPYGTANTQIAVEAAITTLANADVDSGYAVTIAPGSTYSTATKIWTGKLTVTNTTTASNTATDATYRTITIATAADVSGAATELAKVTTISVQTLPTGTANTQASVESAMLVLANADVDSAYTVTIAPGSTYSAVTKAWTGKFVVTNNTTATNTVTDATYRTFIVAQ